MTHIDVQSALAEAMSMPYHDLVTRRTGAAVRVFVEHQLSGLADGSVAFLDFSRIRVLDRSCADEFVAKLMLPLTSEHPTRDGYVVLHGVSRLSDPGRGLGLKGIRGWVHRFDGKLTVRSGTARIAPIIPDWDDDIPRQDDLPKFPGTQLQVIIPKRVVRE